MKKVTERQAREAFAYVQKAVTDGYPLRGRPNATDQGSRLYRSDNPDIPQREFRRRYDAAVKRFGLKIEPPEMADHGDVLCRRVFELADEIINSPLPVPEATCRVWKFNDLIMEFAAYLDDSGASDFESAKRRFHTIQEIQDDVERLEHTPTIRRSNVSSCA